jgi:3-hydroxyisobutyrate dehydrogenase-like beta-hydroxyacid dehydrogenase
MTSLNKSATILGFVGLGTMGGRMVNRFLKAGYQVVGHNRTQSRAEWLVNEGMGWADSPKSVAEQADITFSMVANDEALTAVALGENGIEGGLKSGKIYVDMSTVSPNTIREVAAALAGTGGKMLEAPVSGSTTVVEQGKLVFMVGGEEATLEKVKPILHGLGPSITFLGPIGHAATMKLAINLCIPIQLIAMYEGVLLAEKGGIPRETAIDMIANSAAGSLAMKYRGPLALNLPEEPTFNVNMMQKDTRLALALGRELEVPLLTVGLTNELLTAARSLGYGEEDLAALFQTLAKISGVE